MIQSKNESILCSHLNERMNLSVLKWNDLEVRLLREKILDTESHLLYSTNCVCVSFRERAEDIGILTWQFEASEFHNYYIIKSFPIPLPITSYII